MEDDWLQEAKEVEEGGTAESEEKDRRVNLQGPRVSHHTMLEGTSSLAFPFSQPPHQPTLLKAESLLRSPATEIGMRATRGSRHCTDLESPEYHHLQQ